MKNNELKNPGHTLIDLQAITYENDGEKTESEFKEKASRKIAEIWQSAKLHISEIVPEKLQTAASGMVKELLSHATQQKYFKLFLYAFGVCVFYLLYSILQEEIVVMRNSNEKIQLVICFCGVFVCYLLFGLAQEKVLRGDYNGERFTYAQSLVFVQCIVNGLFARAVTHFLTKPEPDNTPKSLYAACAFCYMGAMVASNQALIYINYPTQVLGKACKPIPVMIMGVIFAHKRYPLVKYFCILLIVLGVAGFMYKDGNADATKKFDIGWGQILLLTSLTLDGFTGVTQEKMRSMHYTNEHHMMQNINFWSCAMLGTVLIFDGQGVEFIYFVMRHPHIIWYLAMFSLTSALGQHFIFLTVVTFGPLTTSVITTTRKFFTIFFSVLIFRNPMSLRQWFATLLVFAGLGLDAKFGRSIKKESKDKAGQVRAKE